MSVATDSSYSVKFNKGKGEKIGISFVKKDGGISIANVKPDGIASQTVMKEGDKVISINGKSLEGHSSQSAAKALRNSSGPIEILLEDESALAVANAEDSSPPEQAPEYEEEKDSTDKNFNCWECTVQ